MTTSQWPASATRSTNSFITPTMVSCRRRVARGVNALEQRLRNRWWASPSMHSRLLATLSHSGPDVMPWTSRIQAGRDLEPVSRRTERTRW